MNEKRLELLKVWFSLFTIIMDMPQDGISNHCKLELLYKLHNIIKRETPEMEQK